MAERRVDPDDGRAYTFEQMSSFCKGKYKPAEIDAYWKVMVPAKGKGKGNDSGYNSRSSAGEAAANSALPADFPKDIEFLDIDGSFGEGGGQVLRNTFAYAAVLGRAIRVFKIRNGRPKPGLANQHLTGINAVSDLSRGKLYGAEVRSMTVHFVPSAGGPGELSALVADCGTAGALTLVIQSILPVMACGSRGSTPRLKTVVTCKGGTDVPFSPAMDYMRNVTLANLSHFGVSATIEVVARGIMPKGGGVVNVSCDPVTQLSPMKLVDFGQLASVKITTLYCGANISEDIALEVAAATAGLIWERCHCSVQVEEEVLPMAPLGSAPSNYLSVSVIARSSTGCVLNGNALHSAKKVSPKRLAEEACTPLLADIARGACLDEHCADQMIIFMALATGVSVFRTGPLTEHTRTAIHFAQLCTGAEFQVNEVSEAKHLFEVICTGMGWRGEGGK